MSDSTCGPLSASVLGEPAIAQELKTLDLPLDQVGAYRVLERVGEGGMGEVYKAERRSPRQTVALKVVKLGMNSREIVARFESERQALAMMDHPGIARVLDAGTTLTGRPYFAMDFVAGKPITDFCDENRLSVTDRLKLFSQVCDAIGHAHTKAIIHRDIKPSNVLAYLQDGVPAAKVIDFGIAKALSGDRLSDLTVYTRPGHAIGTYECMSPEQVEGSPDIDTRTDVYSLGVLLYELLAGTKPFDRATLAGGTDEELRRVIREEEPARPSTRLILSGEEGKSRADRRRTRVESLARELRNELEWIPLMAMRKERSRRYDSPAQLAQDVQNYLQGRPLLAGPESSLYRVRKYVHRHWQGIAIVTTIACIAAGSAALYVHNIRTEQSRTRNALAESEAQRAEAQRQATIATDSNRFLANVLASAQPNNSLGEQVTVVQAMERAIATLDSREKQIEPITEAMIRFVVGATLQSLGRFDEALPQLLLARELDRQTRSAGDPQTRVTLVELGRCYAERGKFAEAEPIFRESLELCRTFLPPDDPEIAKSLSHIGTLLRNTNRFEEAETVLQQVIDIRRQSLPANDPEIPSAINNLAALYWNQGKLAEAEPLVRESLSMRKATLPPGHPNIAQSLNNLATILRDQHKYVEAEPLCREALAMRRKALPAGHPDIGTILHSLAWILNAQGRLDEAEEACREALAIRKGALPADHPFIASTSDDLGWVLQRKGRLDEAEPLYREALQIRTARFGATAAPTTQIAGRLASLLDLTHRSAEASALRAERGLAAPTTQPVTRPAGGS